MNLDILKICKTAMIIIGIDPGLTGAVAVLDNDKSATADKLDIIDIPIVDKIVDVDRLVFFYRRIGLLAVLNLCLLRKLKLCLSKV